MSRLKFWPVIRHCRFMWLSWQVDRHYDRWSKAGYLPTYRIKDLEILIDIWEGRA